MINDKLLPLRQLLEKQCQMVGVSVDEFDFEQPDWYLLHTWTDSQQEEYRLWLIDYFTKNKKLYRKIATGPANKTNITSASNWWILQFGWKVKED